MNADKEHLTPRQRQAAIATQAQMRAAALKAADDPRRLAFAARIVRAALATGKLTPSDLRGPIVAPKAAP